MRIDASVPGNLLLAGEYAVLEPGGLGIAIAVERRVGVRVVDAPALEIAGSWGGEGARWRPDGGGDSALFDALVRCACRERPPPCVRVEVDSSAFFAEPGRKMGYGSSAAVAVGVGAALLRGASSEVPALEEVWSVALAAHRAFQGGRGSGYDVAASLHGGTGLFTGGDEPAWKPVELPWLQGAVVFQGERSVPTSGATARYGEWKRREPVAARRFLEDSMRGVRDLLDAPTADRARATFLRLRDIGLRLGDAIGVSAAIEPPAALRRQGGVWKALGAGNEIGILLPDQPADPTSGGEPLHVAAEGLVWLP